MESNQTISELLVQTGAFIDLDVPVILASGELGIYYVNTEKLCQDGGEFKKHGDDSVAMIRHAVRMMREHPTFESVIDILVDKTRELMGESYMTEACAISGGQRRDWLFSGPIANRLGLPHVSLYKDGKMELVGINGTYCSSVDSLKDFRVIHVVDLITKASSCYRVKDEKEKGWIPMLRDGKATIEHLLAVVTRLQGGEGTLAEHEVTVHPFVAIDQDFVREYSTNPQRALAYIENPEAWSKSYLRRNGALAFVGTFDPNGEKLDKARAFLDEYKDFLASNGRGEELEKAVLERYGKPLDVLVGGN